MAKEQTKYIADDGTAFDTLEEAEHHDAVVQDLKKVEDYISAAGLEKAQAGLMRKHLPQWLAFLNNGVAPKREEPKPKKEKVADAAKTPEPQPDPAPTGDAQKLED